MGKTLSEEHRRKISEANKGKAKGRKCKPRSDEYRKKVSARLTGRKLSEEHRRNIGLSSKGRFVSEATRAKLSNAMRGNKYRLGHKLTEEHKKNISLAHLKRNIGKSKIIYRRQRGPRWEAISKDYRTAVNDRCESCGRKQKKGYLQVHHIIPWHNGGKSDWHNLMALCKSCHPKIEKYKKTIQLKLLLKEAEGLSGEMSHENRF